MLTRVEGDACCSCGVVVELLQYLLGKCLTVTPNIYSSWLQRRRSILGNVLQHTLEHMVPQRIGVFRSLKLGYNMVLCHYNSVKQNHEEVLYKHNIMLQVSYITT